MKLPKKLAMALCLASSLSAMAVIPNFRSHLLEGELKTLARENDRCRDAEDCSVVRYGALPCSPYSRYVATNKNTGMMKKIREKARLISEIEAKDFRGAIYKPCAVQEIAHPQCVASTCSFTLEYKLERK